MVWDCLIVGLLWLHHIQSLANVTMATKSCNLLYGKNDIRAVMLPWQPEMGKHILRVLLALGVKHVRISFEPHGRFSCLSRGPRCSNS
jgi:hypothetical protein